MRKIDQLKAIIDSQEQGYGFSKIEPSIKSENGGHVVILDCADQGVAFLFDSTGEKFLGIRSYQE